MGIATLVYAGPHYSGTTLSVEGGYVSVVVDGGNIVWKGEKVYKNKKKADRKADKIAKDMSNGVIASDYCDDRPGVDC